MVFEETPGPAQERFTAHIEADNTQVVPAVFNGEALDCGKMHLGSCSKEIYNKWEDAKRNRGSASPQIPECNKSDD